MDRQNINVPGAEALSQGHSRRDFLKAIAAASVGAVAGSSLLTSRASAQGGGFESDVDIANFALTLEFLEADFYARAVNAGVLSGSALGVVTNLRDHEIAHAEAIIDLLEGAGAQPVEEPQFTFPPESLSSQQGVLDLASQLEPTGQGAYIGAGPMIQDPNILAAAGSIAGVEGEHVVSVRNLLGFVPPITVPFPEALSKDEVLEAIAPFLGMQEMPDTGGVDPASL